MSAAIARATLVLVVLSLASPAQAQEGKRYALLVGVTEYDSGTLTALKYAENDAEKMADVLKGYDEILVLTTSRGKKDTKLAPTAANIRAALKRVSDKVKRNDLLLVGLSGHGLMLSVVDPKTKKEREESFFCPQDARPRRKESLDELEKSMLPLGELFRKLDDSGAGVRLILVDACRNEVEGTARSIDFDTLPRTRKGTAVLFSCSANEKAFESKKLRHGVFFHQVIEGLRIWSGATSRIG